MAVHDTTDGVLIVNDVGLEKYLYGVVPDEMPPLWEMEALKAQAVAARSYALATRRSSGIFDGYDDTRSSGLRQARFRTPTLHTGCRRDERAGGAPRGFNRHDVLLLDLRRSDSSDRGRVAFRLACALPTRGLRSDGRRLALSSVGGPSSTRGVGFNAPSQKTPRAALAT